MRVTEADKNALAATPLKEPLTYRRDGDRYIVYYGQDRLGFVRRDSSKSLEMEVLAPKCRSSVRQRDGLTEAEPGHNRDTSCCVSR